MVVPPGTGRNLFVFQPHIDRQSTLDHFSSPYFGWISLSV
jgi:hypothetical protein